MELVAAKDLVKELAQLKRSLKPVAKEAYVFGSVLTGAVPMEGDVDVLVVPKKKLGYKELYDRTATALYKILGRGLALHFVIASSRHDLVFLRQAKILKLV